MTFEEVNNLLDEVTAFLQSLGSYYGQVTGKLESNVLECLALGQYLLHRDSAGKITHFLCYWMIDLEALEALDKGARPGRVTGGTVMFTLEHGNRDGRPGMTKMVKEIRLQEPQIVGTAWRHKGGAIRFFPHQRSRKVGGAPPEPKKTPLEELAGTMAQIRQFLQNVINETMARPEIPDELKVDFSALSESLLWATAEQVDMLMRMNRELMLTGRAVHIERNRLASENNELWEAALGGKAFTHQGHS